MTVTVKKLDKLKRILTIAVEGEELKKEKVRLCQTLGRKLKVPGFREGTAPLHVLEKHHGSLLRDEFAKWAIPFYYEKALSDNAFIPVSTPRIFDVEDTLNKLIFSAEIELKPEIALGESMYKGIKLKDKKAEVNDAEWNKLWENVKENVKKCIEKEYTAEGVAKWSGYPSVEDFRQAALIELKSVKLRQRRQDIDSQVVNALLKNVKIEVPPRLVQEHLEKILNQEIFNLKVKGVSEEDIEKNKRDLEEKLKPLAKDQVKLYYILEAIAKKENIKIDSNTLYERVLGYLLSAAEYR